MTQNNDPDAKLAMAVNAAQTAIAARRIEFLKSHGGIDNKRPKAWIEYGYPDHLTFNDFYAAYDRQGLAHGVVHLLAEKCWENPPTVMQDGEDESAEAQTPWEDEFNRLAKRTRLWQAMAKADVRRLVGHFAGILLHVADSQAWDTRVKDGKRIVKLTPVWQGQLKAAEYNTDETSEHYGQVTLWQYDEGAIDGMADADQVGLRTRTLTVHHSRIVIIGDYYGGRSFLKAGFNALINMEKILGGSGESFLKNASRQIHLGFDKEVDLAKIAKDHGVPLADLQGVFDQTARDMNRGIDSVLVTQGATAAPLVSAVPLPQEHYTINLMDAAIAYRIPSKIISGMQTGERASTEDARQFNQRCLGRCLGDLTDDTMRVVEHLIEWGLIRRPPREELSIIWDDLTAPTTAEKLDQAAKMAEVNQKMLGVGPVFTEDEIREAGGYANNADLPPLPEDE